MILSMWIVQPKKLLLKKNWRSIWITNGVKLGLSQKVALFHTLGEHLFIGLCVKNINWELVLPSML